MQEDPQQPQEHRHTSSSSLLTLVTLIFVAVLFALFALMEVQILRLQHTVDKAVEIYSQSDRTTKGENIPRASTQTKTPNKSQDANNPEDTNSHTTNDEVRGPTYVTYTNSDLGYRVSMYPDTTTEQHGDDILFHGEVDFDIRRSGDGSVTQIYPYLDGEVTDTATVDGHTANVTKSITGYCDGPGCGSPYIAYSMLEDGYNYTLVFYGDAVLSANESEVLSSFEFLN